jgi:hypothetical protein
MNNETPTLSLPGWLTSLRGLPQRNFLLAHGGNPLSHVGKCLLLEPIYLHHLVVVLLLLGLRPYTAVAVGASPVAGTSLQLAAAARLRAARRCGRRQHLSLYDDHRG